MSQESEYATMNANPQNTCIVCYKNVEIFSVGMCEHPVCFECSTRMRVLCQQNECPICRQDLPKVVFTREIKPFRHLRKGHLFDSKYNIHFEDEGVMEKFNMLLAHSCNICKNNEDHGNFSGLKNHMRSKHELHYCDLCVENLRIFSRERRCYSRADLARHRREGDTDDKSHKGHPLCKFCDTRYMDNDELYRHLRRDHLYCHFCDADGFHRYYCSYPDLRDHFRDEHYLCEEGACVGEQFTSVFRSDIDLKAHKANVHCRQLGKAAAKQARTLELEFTLSPRGDRGSRRCERGPGRSSYHNQEVVEHPVPEIAPTEITFARQQPQVDVQSTEQFPTLGNTVPIIPVISHAKTKGNLTIRSRLGQPMITDEDFPALGGPEAPSCSGISNTLNLSVSQAQSNVSIHVNHKSNGTVTTRVSGNNIRIRPTRADFPALGGNSEPLTLAPNVGQWTKVMAKIKPKEVEHRTRKPAVISAPLSIQSGSDFPSLKPKTSKSSSISIVPSQTSLTTNCNDSTKGKTKKKKNQPKNGNVDTKKIDSQVTNGKKTKSAEDNSSPRDCLNLVASTNTNNVQRKRSELKIEGLASTNNNPVMRSEDFPALGNAKVPPGLAKPPPGFNASNAPPGFSSKQVNDNRLTFTNSSGESYAIVPNESQSRSYVYMAPTDFQKRNQNLVASVNQALDNDEAIKEFRYLSGLFRQGVCDPQEFYIRCRSSMGISTFERIFPELLLLLPDIEKQRELFSIHKMESSGKVRGLEECTTCGQIVRNSELKSHKSCHDLEKHFPALDIATQSNSWARK